MAYSEKTRTSVNKNNLKLTADKVIQILDQVRDEGKKSRRRWIWELMQNAKDIPNIYNRVSVEIELSDSELTFKHNGNPFRIDNITGLIQQVSSKPSDSSEEETTGKFGTGFISTHLLSDIIKVRGIVQEPEEIAKKFELLLDRSGEKSEELMPAIEAALDLVDSIDDNILFPPFSEYTDHRSEKDLDNEFIYGLNSDSAKKAASIGVDDLKITLPLTLAFIPKIKQVKVKNKLSGEDTVYSCNILKTINKVQEIEILISVNDGKPSKICFLIFNEDDIALAVQVEDFLSNILIEKVEAQPFLYRDFPLIGTETFSFPFIVNGKTFFPTERRDSILLNQDGDKNKKPNHNQQIISKAFEASKEFITLLIERNAKNLYMTALSRVPRYDFDEDSKEWYSKLQKNYRDFLLGMEIIDVPDGRNELNKVWFPRHGTIREDSLLLWDIASEFLGYHCVIKKDVLVSALAHIGTYEEKDSWSTPLYFDLEMLFEKIQKAENLDGLKLNGIEKVTDDGKYDWLNKVYDFVIKNKQLQLFEEYSVIPNEKGDFCLLEDMYEEDINKPIPDQFLDVLKSLDSAKDWRDSLINRKVNLSSLNHKKLDFTSVTEAINEILNLEKREGNISHKLFLKNSNALELIISILKIDSPDSKREGIKHQLFNTAKKIFHYTDDFVAVPNSGKFDYRPAIKLFISIISNAVVETKDLDGLAEKLKGTKVNALEWINSFLLILDTNSEYKYFLEEGNIIPNRSGVFCAYKDIYNFGTEERQLDDELIEILKEFDSEKDWNAILLSDGILIRTPNTKKFEELAAELLLEVERIRITEKYDEYSDQLLHFIDWCSNNRNLAQLYLLAFNEMANRIFFILTIENSKYGGQLIKMLKNKDNLEILAQISESNLSIDSIKELIRIGTELGNIDSILEHARDLQHEKSDFDYKLLIGTDVEKAFKDALEKEDIDAEIIHQGWGAYDFEVRNTKNSKSIFIELKSQANGSVDPIRMAISQAKKAFNNPEEFALCVLERPVNNIKADADYIKDNLVYKSYMKNDLEDVLNDFNSFENISSKKEPIRLRIALRDDVKVTIENSLINTSSKGFSDLINDIKKQII